MELENCVYDVNEELSLPDFHKKYREKFPMMAIVVGGHYGPTKWDDLPSDMVMRIEREFVQQRVLAKDTKSYKEQYISIPVNGPYMFNIVRSIKDKCPDQTLAEILENHPLPVLVQFSARREIPKEARGPDGALMSLLIEYRHEEIYLQGNFYLHGVIAKESASVFLCPEISMAPVHGMKDKTEDQYKEYLMRMAAFVKKKSSFSEESCNLGVKVFEAVDPAIAHIVQKEDSIDRGPAPAIPHRSKPSSMAKETSKSKQPNAKMGHRPPLPDRQSIPLQKDNVNGSGKVGKSPQKPKHTPSPEKPPEESDDDIYYGDYDEITEAKIIAPGKKGPGYVNDVLCQVKPFSGQEPPDGEDESDEYEAIEEKLIQNFNGATNKETKNILGSTNSDIYSVPIGPNENKTPGIYQEEASVDQSEDEYAVPEEACELKMTRNFDIPEILSKTDSAPRPNFVSGKSIQELGEILVRLRLERYIDRFAEDLIDGEIVIDLTVEDLKQDYQFTKTEAIRLKKYIEQGHIPT